MLSELPSIPLCYPMSMSFISMYVCSCYYQIYRCTNKRETETDIKRDRDERDRDIREAMHTTGGRRL